MKRGAKLGLGAVAALALAQLVRFPHENPPITSEIAAPPEVLTVLRRSCWDCHSNESVWPWYSQVAPASWLVYRDVVEGRRHLNFSEWDRVPDAKRTKKIRGSAKLAGSGEMPPWFYLPLHSAARLGDADKKVLSDWANLAQ